MKKSLLIDSRIRKCEYEYLSKYFNVIKLPLSSDVYDETSGHSDIFYCKLFNQLIVAPNAKIGIDKLKEIDNKITYRLGNDKVENEYPKDVYYNVCQLGEKIIGSKYSEKDIPVNILVKQGYTKCSIAVTGDKSCITSDIGIFKSLVGMHIEATYINESKIKLLDRKGNETSKHGFIGGASFVYDNKFILFGDIDKLDSKEKIKEHLEDIGLELIDFKGINVHDYGGAIII